MKRLHHGVHQPLRFYPSIEYQNRFRDGASGKPFRLYCPVSRLLPFQVRIDDASLNVGVLRLVSVEDGTETELTSYIDTGQQYTYNFTDHKIYVHYGSSDLTQPLPLGDHYLKLPLSDGSAWCSEVITILDFDPEELTLDGCILSKIVYWDTCDIDDILYRTTSAGSQIQYKNIIYLDVNIGKPTYSYQEEGNEDGKKNFKPTLMRSDKRYQVETVAPEYFVDALTLLPLHLGTGTVEVYTAFGRTSDIDRIVVEPVWQDKKGVWALTPITFISTAVVKTGCCNSEDEPIDFCLNDPIRAVAAIVDGSQNYNEQEYGLADGSDTVSILNGELVIILPDDGLGDKLLRQLDGSSYVFPDPLKTPVGCGLVDMNQFTYGDGSVPMYYFMSDTVLQAVSSNTILDEHGLYPNTLPGNTNYRVKGRTWLGAQINILHIYPDQTPPTFLATMTAAEFMSEDGFDFSLAGIAEPHQIQLRTTFGTCVLDESDPIDLDLTIVEPQGIGEMVVGSSFVVA